MYKVVQVEVQSGAQARSSARRRGFTLIELMVVIAMIGLLVAVMFRLMGTIGASNKRAVTIARIQRLENALSGFYAEYGMYPPVVLYGSPDPFLEEIENKDGTTQAGSRSSTPNSGHATRAARSQPIAFEYPPRRSEDEYIRKYYRAFNEDVISPNEVISSFDENKVEWKDLKLFKFGLLSYLLPRLQVIGRFDNDGNAISGGVPDEAVFRKKQWQAHNLARYHDYQAQLAQEEVAARWMPNLEGLIEGGPTLFGINTATSTPHFPYGRYRRPDGGGDYVLRQLTVRDGWGRDLYYYSAPPYQSYRVWSAGPNGKTFPPGYTDSLNNTQLKEVGAWIADDIVGFDQ